MSSTAQTNSSAPILTSFSLSFAGARRVHLALFFSTGWRTPGPSDDSGRGDRREKWVSMVRALVPLVQVTPGHWECEVPLAPGSHEYLFLVDGEWVLDPTAREHCRDGDGEHNCVRTVERILPSEIFQPAPRAKAARRQIADLRKSVAA